MSRVAAVDLGTNTIRLLVTDLDPASGDAGELLREMRVVRLGQDVDRTGRFAEEALARVFGAVEEYAALVADRQVDAVRCCATSAARDVANAEELLAGVESRLGVRPDVVTGDQEAVLTYDGATRALDVPGPVLVVDIGGGSTELVLGSPSSVPGRGGEITHARSMDVGSVRLTERHLTSDPPTADQRARATADVDALLDASPVPLTRARTVVGVAGTVTTVAAGALGLATFDRAVLDRAVLARTEVDASTRRLLAMTVAQRRALGYMHPGRADVIGAGALILDRVLARTGVDSLLVSEADILDGIAWSCL